MIKQTYKLFHVVGLLILTVPTIGLAMDTKEKLEQKITDFGFAKSGFGELTNRELLMKCLESKIILPSHPSELERDQHGKIKAEIKEGINKLSPECLYFVNSATKLKNELRSSLLRELEEKNEKLKQLPFIETTTLLKIRYLQKFYDAIDMANFTAPRPEDVEVVEEVEVTGENSTEHTLKLKLKKK